MKLHKVIVIIVTQYFNVKPISRHTVSKIQWFETVCQMCPNRPLIRIGSLTSQTDFESKLKLFTQWLQSFPIQLI